MKIISKLLIISFLTCASLLDAAKAVCTCTNNKRSDNVDIGPYEDPTPICRRECEKMGLKLQKAAKRG